MKKFVMFLLLVFLSLSLVGCGQERMPMNVFFKNGTAPGSKNNVLSVVYLKDKPTENFYSDILVKADTDDLEFSLGKEGLNKVNMYIDEAYKWYSLSTLYSVNSGQPKVFQTFKELKNKTFILTSKKKANFTFVCVRGDLESKTNSLINVHNSSNEFKLEVKNV